LIAGTTYFLVANGLNSSSAGWQFSLSDVGPFYFNESGSATGPWTSTNSQISAFEVDGTPVTTREPSSLFLVGAGLLGLVVIGRSKFGRPKSLA